MDHKHIDEILSTARHFPATAPKPSRFDAFLFGVAVGVFLALAVLALMGWGGQ